MLQYLQKVFKNNPKIRINVPACKAICFTIIAFKGVLAEKLRRALENKRYQDKRNSVEGDHFQLEAKKQKTLETDEGKSVI